MVILLSHQHRLLTRTGQCNINQASLLLIQVTQRHRVCGIFNGTFWRADILRHVSDYNVVEFQPFDTVHGGYTDAGLLPIISCISIKLVYPIGQIVIKTLLPLVSKPLGSRCNANIARIYLMKSCFLFTGMRSCFIVFCINIRRRPALVEDPFRHKINLLLPCCETMRSGSRTSHQGATIIRRRVGTTFQIVKQQRHIIAISRRAGSASDRGKSRIGHMRATGSE